MGLQRMRLHALPRRLPVLAAGVLALLVGGCGSSSPRASATVVRVSESDFHIGASTDVVPAGPVTLRIHNYGPDQHELIVAPRRAGGLPLRSDGFTVNEEQLEKSEPGAIEPQQPDHTELLKVVLKPGRYVLFCNMEGHFMAGMHRVLVVR
jgi:uncharacterized cupredoxin-like copper-binding protein